VTAAEGDPDDDLELAFQTLDTARLIFTTNPSLSRFQLAEIHRLLGSVLSESEQFPGAYSEYESSLAVLEKIVEADDRRLSELYLLLAITSEFVTGKEDQAVGWAEKTKSVLEKRAGKLESQGDEGKKELEELRELIKDVDEKVRLSLFRPLKVRDLTRKTRNRLKTSNSSRPLNRPRKTTLSRTSCVLSRLTARSMTCRALSRRRRSVQSRKATIRKSPNRRRQNSKQA
jgi:tetratricopeptide (TPR) repeat protein